MSTHYHRSLQERITNLTAEYARVEHRHAAVVDELLDKPTRDQKRQQMKDWVASNQDLRKVEQQVRHAKRLLARSDGDEYNFKKSSD
jgi:hypothetical protein